MNIDTVDVGVIRKRSIQGIFALMSRTMFINIISFAAWILVTMKLKESEVGVFTAVIAMQRLVSFFTDFGLGAALVQKKELPSQRDLTTTFTIQFLLTLVVFFVVFFSSGFIQSFFHLSDKGTMLLIVLVFTIFLSSFKIIPSILLERDIHFQKLIIPQLTESILFNGILVLLIFQGYTIESFTYAFLIASIASIPVYYFISPWRISFSIDRESLHHLRYGIQFQAKNILATIKDDLLTVILVKFLSFTEIGYIGFAQRLAFFIYRYIVDSVTKVTFSTYARLQESREVLQKAIEKSLFFVSASVFPILAGIIITAPYFIRFVPNWQGKWEPAIISLIFFCLNAMVSSLSGVMVTVLDATGKVKTTLKLMVLWTTLTWVLTPILIFSIGYNGVAIASFLVTLTIGFTVYLLKKVVAFNFLQSIFKPVMATIFMSIVVYFSASAIAHDFISLLFVVLLGATVYCILFYMLAKQEVSKDLALIIAKFRK
ncbi:MAG: oligosaccharide flippase family protein [Candidatus Levybacteria bacterium]|nr:oligosaccharide flippase family protein [Candidatus Levybacteria bacterium]